MKIAAHYIVGVIAVIAWLFVLDQLTGCKAPEEDHDVIEQVPGAPSCIEEHGKDVALSFCLRGETLTICSDSEGCLSVRVQPAIER